jgi:hypothetical protein
MKQFSFLFFVILLYGCSCNSEPPNISQKEMHEMIKDADPTMKIEISTDISKALVDCREFTPNCRIGYRVIVKGLEVNALYYEEQKEAKMAAKRIRGFYLRNWVFDQVKGEPILERFFSEKIKAIPAE